MLIYLLDEKTKQCVAKKLEELKREWGTENFQQFFALSLTDRGTEFCTPESIEIDLSTGELLGKLFYCNSYSSYQKGSLEENHEFIRYVIPKGTSFDQLTQQQATLMASHINSYYRKALDATPYELAVAYFGQDFVEKTRVRPIAPDSVLLNPSLLYK